MSKLEQEGVCHAEMEQHNWADFCKTFSTVCLRSERVNWLIFPSGIVELSVTF